MSWQMRLHYTPIFHGMEPLIAGNNGKIPSPYGGIFCPGSEFFLVSPPFFDNRLVFVGTIWYTKKMKVSGPCRVSYFSEELTLWIPSPPIWSPALAPFLSL
jgi:hypothetical protein